MPAMDKTGPFGTGPVGRGRGPCQQADSSTPAARCQGGQGQGRGRGGNGGGFGRGFGGGGGNRFGQVALTQDEEAAVLEARIAAMQARMNELKQDPSAE